MSIAKPPAFVYISPGLLTNMRREVSRFLLHTYTRTPRIELSGDEDTWGQQITTDGIPIKNNPCFYAVRELPFPTPEGLTTLNVPVLTLSFDDPISIGDFVSDIKTADGTILVVGPVIAESVQPRDPNMGGPVLIECHLRDLEFVTTSNT